MKTFKELRPWGNFEQFCMNKNCTVKVIELHPNQSISLQYHHHRDELWKVLDGNGKVILGEEILPFREGQTFFIPRGTTHRIIAESSVLRLLEICFGEFDESDIVRIEDKYNRQVGDLKKQELEQKNKPELSNIRTELGLHDHL